MMSITRALGAAILLLLSAAAAVSAAEVKAGDLTIRSAWARATPPGAPAGGAYVAVTNGGQEPDRLMSASSPQAGQVQIHEMSVAAGVMKMRALPEGVAVPPGATVELKPGGNHIMLIGLKRPLVAGDKLKATLVFEKAGPVDVEFDIRPIGASGPAEGEQPH